MMTEDGDYVPASPARPRHYHGDLVRGLFIAGAVLIFLTQFVGTKLPFSTSGLMFIVLVHVIAAGITNPAQTWIHWVNAIIAAISMLYFGSLALARLDTLPQLFSSEGIVAALALVFLAALYLSIRTIRGFSVPHIAPERNEY